MNALDDSSMNYSEGNLRPTPSADYKATRGTIGIPTSGKWYFENTISGSNNKFTIGNVQDQMIGVVHLLMFSLVQVLIHSHLHMVLVILGQVK